MLGLLDLGRYVALAGKHCIGGRQQIGGNRAFDHEAIRTGVQDRAAYAWLVVNAEHDHFHRWEGDAKPTDQFETVTSRQRKIDHGQIALQAPGALEQRDFVSHHDDRSEHGGKETADSIAHATMWVSYQHEMACGTVHAPTGVAWLGKKRTILPNGSLVTS
jgi:hypothetical protein